MKLFTRIIFAIFSLFVFFGTTLAKPNLPDYISRDEFDNYRIEQVNESKQYIKDITGTNGTYLAISVGAIFSIASLISALFYFFNFKPAEEKSKKQEQDLKDTQSKLNEQSETQKKQQIDLENLKEKIKADLIKMHTEIGMATEQGKQDIQKTKIELEEKIILALKESEDKNEKRIKLMLSGAEGKINNLIFKSKQHELDLLWNSHYIWESLKVPSNVVTTLIDYFEKSIEYGQEGLIQEWNLIILNKNLEEMIEKKWNSFSKRDEERLLKLLDKIKGMDTIKKLIINNLGKLGTLRS